MPTSPTPTVLIGCSKQFNNKVFFKEKTSKILSDLESYKIIAVENGNGLISEFFGERVIKTHPYNSRTSSINKIVDESTFVILFWDGTDISEFVYRALLLKKHSRIISVETTKVVNKDKGDPYDIYIGRGTPWGNPFAIGDDGMSREQVIAKYEQYFNETFIGNEQKRKELLGLKGKILGCHCKPLACHGDIIATYLNTIEDA